MTSQESQTAPGEGSLVAHEISLTSADIQERPSLDGKSMTELLESYSYPEIFDLVASEGIVHLGSLNLREGVVTKAFGKEKIIWEMADEYNPENWYDIWDKRLTIPRAKTCFGPTQYWKAEAYAVSLKNAAAPSMEGLLYPICRKLEMGAVSPLLFSSALIRAVVGFKWHWTRRVIFFEFSLFLIWLTAFFTHATIYERDVFERGIFERIHLSERDAVSAIALFVAIIFMLPFCYISICEIVCNGLSHWFTFWNLFDVLAQLNQVICFFYYYFGTDISPDTYAVLLSVQTVLLVLKIQYFSRAVLQVEVAFIDNLSQMIPEAAAFLLFWMLTLFSFSVAIYCLFKDDLERDDNPQIELYYGSVWHSWFTLFGSMFKRFTYDPLLDSVRSISVTLFFSIFLFLNTVILYNLLVSIVVSFNKKMKALSQMKLDTGRAAMVVELETAIPKRYLKKLDKAYIHFLRVVPPEEIDLSKLWMDAGYGDETHNTGKEVFSKKIHEAEAHIMQEIEVRHDSNVCICSYAFYDC